jgi:hypothetical protein
LFKDAGFVYESTLMASAIGENARTAKRVRREQVVALIADRDSAVRRPSGTALSIAERRWLSVAFQVVIRDKQVRCEADVVEHPFRIRTRGMRHDAHVIVVRSEVVPQVGDSAKGRNRMHPLIHLRPAALIAEGFQVQRVNERVVQIE